LKGEEVEERKRKRLSILIWMAKPPFRTLENPCGFCILE
jgi:hypothetical protein